ncbi:MAG: hypothetical protein CALGDGBN_02792 [Pseudomonadales bacterium]|nr:hypothetical protein [Pseudomonadales bacterium]
MRQRGVALITVLLVFALAAILMTQMLSASYFALRRTGNLVDSVQADYLAAGAGQLARALLAADAASSTTAASNASSASIDHLGEPWAARQPVLPVEDGQVEVRIVDLAGRFNVNSLVDASGHRVADAQARFARLLRSLALDPSLATDAADCLDADRMTARGTPEAAAACLDRPLADIATLRAALTLAPEDWRRLAPHVAALPQGTRLNINTATPEVLRAYVEHHGATNGLAQFLDARTRRPALDPDDVTPAGLFGPISTSIDVRSAYFAVYAHVRHHDRSLRTVTVLHRDGARRTIVTIGRREAAASEFPE